MLGHQCQSRVQPSRDRGLCAKRVQRLRVWPCRANASSDEVVPEASEPSSWPLKAAAVNGSGPLDEDGASLEEKATALRAELGQLKDNEKGLPHRWVVVIAMIAAFVLCNMDKVRRMPRRKLCGHATLACM